MLIFIFTSDAFAPTLGDSKNPEVAQSILQCWHKLHFLADNKKK